MVRTVNTCGLLMSSPVLAASPAALVTTFVVLRPDHPGQFLGLVPLRPVRRLIGYAVIGLMGGPLLELVALGLGDATGSVQVRLGSGGYSPADLRIPHPLPVPPGMTATTLGLLVLAAIPVSSLSAAIAAFGEELGWRGLLLPTLRPLGTWPALILTGVIWGVWHAPIILLGYEYDRPDLAGVLEMVVLIVLVGTLLGWLRMRSNSIWPCALAHGSFNAAQSAILLVLINHPETGLQTPLAGWTGWATLLTAIAVLALARQYWWAEAPPTSPPITSEPLRATTRLARRR
jgi:uncharacterized protein